MQMTDTLTTYLVNVETPDGGYTVECPTYCGPDAAERRVVMSLAARFGYPLDKMASRVMGRV